METMGFFWYVASAAASPAGGAGLRMLKNPAHVDHVRFRRFPPLPGIGIVDVGSDTAHQMAAFL